MQSIILQIIVQIQILANRQPSRFYFQKIARASTTQLLTLSIIKYYTRTTQDYIIFVKIQMGQEQSAHEYPSEPSPRTPTSLITSTKKTAASVPRNILCIECEGLLKLRTTPFKNSIQIQTQNEVLFLQNVDTTLKQLLQPRLNTKKLFLIQDIQKLIEETTYTLAHLQQKNITYKDIHPQYIYYQHGNFKLLPNELIDTNTYQKLKQQQEEVTPSPELIIALRCGEEDVTDDDILQKSNVFTLGMTILQVTTLLPSHQCYDPQNYDILDPVINQRIALVQEYYGDKIARIIANMLDYDYTERMGFKELSIWVNRQLQPSRVTEHHSQNMVLPFITSSKVQKQPDLKHNQSQTQTTSIFGNDKQRNRLTKNNSVYMGLSRQNQGAREDRNKIYIHEGHRQEEPPRVFHDQHPVYTRKRKQMGLQNIPRYQKQVQLNNHSFNQSESFRINDYVKQELRQPNPYCEDFKFPTKKQEQSDRRFPQKQSTRRIAKENPYRNQQQQNRYVPKQPELTAFQYPTNKKQKTPLKEVGNQYYPNIEDILKLKNNPSNNLDIKGPIGENGALNRIKEQILKSRKLIEQFKRSEGLKF